MLTPIGQFSFVVATVFRFFFPSTPVRMKEVTENGPRLVAAEFYFMVFRRPYEKHENGVLKKITLESVVKNWRPQSLEIQKDNGMVAMLDDKPKRSVIQHGFHTIVFWISRDWLQTKNTVQVLLWPLRCFTVASFSESRCLKPVWMLCFFYYFSNYVRRRRNAL